MVKNAIILPNLHKDPDLSVTTKLIKKLLSLDFSVYAFPDSGIDPALGISLCSEPPESTDVIFVVGGDGSVIDASRLAIEIDAPVLGVNVGKLGYLSEVEPDNMDVLDSLKEGNFVIEEKLLLTTEHVNVKGITKLADRRAVNDVVISQDGYFGIAHFRVKNHRGEQVCYRGNGVIIATPVGSTAYSLSAGGPIISHSLESITVTPVCPHSFFNRSIVFDSNEVISVINTGELDLNISIDGRNFMILKQGDECKIYSSKHKLKMITFNESNMFSTLFKKIRVIGDNV